MAYANLKVTAPGPRRDRDVTYAAWNLRIAGGELIIRKDDTGAAVRTGHPVPDGQEKIDLRGHDVEDALRSAHQILGSGDGTAAELTDVLQFLVDALSDAPTVLVQVNE